MTQPTPDYSSQVPNTVIGNRPEGYDPIGTLTDAVKGHQAILGAIRDHTQHESTLREIARQSGGNADLAGR